MAKKFNIKWAKVEIDGKDGYKAHTWTLITGIDKAEIVINCHDLDDARKLSIKNNPGSMPDIPRHDILLVDLRGVELRYSADLMNVERTPFDDGVDQIEYHFKIAG